jgi:hypothetical protein
MYWHRTEDSAGRTNELRRMRNVIHDSAERYTAYVLLRNIGAQKDNTAGWLALCLTESKYGFHSQPTKSQDDISARTTPCSAICVTVAIRIRHTPCTLNTAQKGGANWWSCLTESAVCLHYKHQLLETVEKWPLFAVRITLNKLRGKHGELLVLNLAMRVIISGL